MSLGVISEVIDFMRTAFGVRTLAGSMNFLMWFGNTTIMLMAAIMGISPDIFEASGNRRMQQYAEIFPHHPSADPSDSCLYIDHIHYRRSADV